MQITRLTNILFDPRKTIKQKKNKKNEIIVMTIMTCRRYGWIDFHSL